MNAKRWQALVMVAFAWVHWRQQIGISNFWIPVEGYEKKAGCVKRRALIFEALKMNGKKQKKNIFSELYFGEGSLAFFRCLPSDMNPIPLTEGRTR